MNKKYLMIYYYCSVLVLALLVVFAFNINKYKPEQIKVIDEPIKIVEPTPKKNGVNIGYIQESYQNSDIIGYLSIPNVLNYPVVQASDNDYYLRRSLNGTYALEGTPFMDYRTSFEDKKILIYGHSGNGEEFAFLPLHQYENESFYKEHSVMYLYSTTKKYTYEIFSSYLETEDYDYVNINSFRGLSWLEHINKLKNKSDYNTNITLTDDSKILILQTCNIEDLRLTGRYRLVMGLLTKIEDNLYE